MTFKVKQKKKRFNPITNDVNQQEMLFSCIFYSNISNISNNNVKLYESQLWIINIVVIAILKLKMKTIPVFDS